MIALYNGKIYSQNKFEEAILIDGKYIKAIGKNSEILKHISADKEKINLEGKVVLPGFIDSHAHGPLSISSVSGKIDMTAGTSRDEYLELVKNFINQNSEKEIFMGMGWLNPAFDKNGPDKEALDRICSDTPVVLKSGDGHSVWCNSIAIEKAGINKNTPDPEGGFIERNQDGSLRGTFRDQAQELILKIVPEPTVDEFKEAIAEFQEMMIRYGHTAVFDPMVDIDGNMIKAYREMSEAGELKIKFGLAYTSDPKQPETSIEQYEKSGPVEEDKLTEGSFVKIFVDGVVEGGTAFLKEDYCNKKGYRGEPLWEQSELNKFCARVDKIGYDIHFHVIGDAAVRQMIDAMKYVRTQNGYRERNTVAAHMQIVDPQDYRQLKELDISISANPYWFVKAPGYYENIEIPVLGYRAEKEYPMKTFFDLGITVSAGSDFAVTPRPYPMAGIQLAMLRTVYGEDHTNPENVLNGEEKITIEQGLQAFTENGAKTMGISSITGSLEVGKYADIVVMEENIFDISPEKLSETSVFMTISEGSLVYRKEV